MPARTFAFGDIHGCLDQLDALLAAIKPAAKDHLVFLGDYIDRGPQSAGVLNRLIEISRRCEVTTLRGNHEQMFLDARSGPHEARAEWLLNGGMATLFSYAGTRAQLSNVPRTHWNFLEKNLRDYLETDTHIFVHANVDPSREMPDQDEYVMLWERCTHSAPHISGKTVIVGHTPQKSGLPLNKGHLICLDTDACRGGPLTCLQTSTGRYWQAHRNLSITRGNIDDHLEE